MADDCSWSVSCEGVKDKTMADSKRETRYGQPTVSVPDSSWLYLVEVFQSRFPNTLISLTFRFERGHGTLEAQVGSEKGKTMLDQLFREHPFVVSLDSTIIVAAPFRSAHESDPTDGAFESFGINALSGDTVTVERFPSIEVAGDLKVGQAVVVVVRLNEEVDWLTEGAASSIEGVPAGWKAIEVEVSLDAEHLEFEENDAREKIVVRRDQKCRPAYFYGHVASSAANAKGIQINAHFFYEGRKCGFAKHVVPLAESAPEKGPVGNTNESAMAASGAVSIQPGYGTSSSPAAFRAGLDASDLIISIDKDDFGPEGRYRWLSYSAAVGGMQRRKETGVIDLGTSARDYALDLLNRSRNLSTGAHARAIRGIGQQIWEAAPQQFKEHYLSLVSSRGANFPIQVFSDEVNVPWEMMWPSDPSSDQDFDHLFMRHPIARWPGTSSLITNSFKAGMIASFVPTYVSRPLPAAQAEGLWLQTELGAVAHETSYNGFLDFLENPPANKHVQIVHFAGHGSSAAPDSPASIEMDALKMITVDEVRQGAIKLGKRDHPLFILNACEVGTNTNELGLADGWAMALIGNKFGGVIAPLWPIDDEDSGLMIQKTLVSFLKSGETLAESLRQARVSARTLSPTPFCYVLYGDVMARAESANAATS